MIMTKENIPLIVLIALLTVVGVAGYLYAANEVTVTTYLKVTKDNFDLTRNVSNQRFDKNGDASSYAIQGIGTNSHEALSVVADLSTNGWAFMRCTPTNQDRWVDIGVQDSNSVFLAFLRLKGGECGVFKLNPSATVYAQGGSSATTAVPTVDLEFWINQD